MLSLIAAFPIVVCPPSAANARTDTTKLNPAEKWVVEQLKIGEIANLSEHFRTEKDRKLSARFLENLLTATLPGVKLHRNGVRISGAIIDDPIEMWGPKITAEVWLQNCQFGDVLLVRASFEGALNCNASTFKAANFNSVKIASSAFFENVVFEGFVDFRAATICGALIAKKAHFNDNSDGADFRNMAVGSVVFVDDAVFEGPAQFDGMTVSGDFIAEGAHFNDKQRGVTFSGIKAKDSTYFNKAVFEGPVNFVDAHIEGSFDASHASFNNKEKEANFNSITVTQYAYFVGAIFEGKANFSFARVTNNLEVFDAEFRNKKQPADFYAIKVGQFALFTDTVFEGPVDFGSGQIASNFQASGAEFRNKEQRVSFNSIKIGHSAYFKHAVFLGPVDFVSAEISSNLELDEAGFRNAEQPAVFASMKVGQSGSFEGAIFDGPLDFSDSSFLDLRLDATGNGLNPVPMLDLSRASIKRQLSIEGLSIRDLKAESLHVEGPAHFTELTIQNSADFSEADFTTLDLWRSVFPKEWNAPWGFQLQGMTYKILRADPEESISHKKLLKLINQSTFSADVYGNLEAFLLRQGYNSDADTVFIAGKRRDGKESLRRKDYLHWFSGKLLDWFVGYGRHPWHAAIPCALFVGLGCFLFSSKKMEPLHREETTRVYNPFWYSLGLFLPIVNLQSDGVWKPKKHCYVLRHYLRIHILLGWILIPLVVAALTGLIK